MKWQPVELIANYWIILDSDKSEEYRDQENDNLVFETKKETINFIKQLKGIL